MPWYILQRVLAKLHTPKKDSCQSDKLSRLDTLLAHLGFNLSLNLDRISLSVKDDRKLLYSFQSPDHMTLSIHKNDHDCGFDLLGFKFTGTNSL
jgi:hypothetical protein